MIRTMILAAAAISTLSPVLSHAAPPSRQSVDACARAFAASLATPGSNAPAYKLAYRNTLSGGAGTLAEVFPAEYVYVMEAMGPGRHLLARAQCSTNVRGEVTAISNMPLDAKPAALADQF